MSDYSPPYTDEDAKAELRRDRTVARTHKLKLKYLTVADMLAIVGIFYHRNFGIGESDVKRLEGIIKRSKQ